MHTLSKAAPSVFGFRKMKPPHQQSRPKEYFEKIYAENSDPWDFKGSEYEQTKYSRTISAFGDRHFENAFEVGCSIGVLTQRLAPRCKRLLAMDLAEGALRSAKATCSMLTHVQFAIGGIPQDWPCDERFDLILFSEILYFLTPGDIQRTVEMSLKSLCDDGMIVLVNYTEPVPDPCQGAEAAEIFIGCAGPALKPIRQEAYEKYRIDVLSK